MTSLAAGCALTENAKNEKKKPNFVIIFTDDQGYQDLGCFGSELIKTPRIDRMATEGARFTDFYAQTICGPSRAALLTGCYPLRVAKRQNNQIDAHPRVHLDEVTVAEVLKEAGYATACFGKWDQAGHEQEPGRYEVDLLPTRQGFDYYFGTPSSNDAYVNLLRNEKIIERKADMSTLTKRYTDEAIGFIRENQDRPFFVYIPHTMPHTQLAASEQFRGKSERGLYGDVIEEIDWNTGRLLDEIKELGLDDNTYVIFLSDNGPWYKKREHGGTSSPLRSAKTSAWEGGPRVPCVMRAPGKIPAGITCSEVASTLDILPTFATLAGGRVPDDRVIDGHDISGLMHGEPGAKSQTQAFFYYQHTHLQAVRAGRWKLHLPHAAISPWSPRWANQIAPEDLLDIEDPLLFDLENDIGEQTDVAADHPAVVKELLALAEDARDDIGDYDRIGKNARFFDPEPRRPDIAQWKSRVEGR